MRRAILSLLALTGLSACDSTPYSRFILDGEALSLLPNLDQCEIGAAVPIQTELPLEWTGEARVSFMRIRLRDGTEPTGEQADFSLMLELQTNGRDVTLSFADPVGVVLQGTRVEGSQSELYTGSWVCSPQSPFSDSLSREAQGEFILVAVPAGGF